MSTDELKRFYTWKSGKYLPNVYAKKSLGDYDANGQQQDPILSLGKGLLLLMDT